MIDEHNAKHRKNLEKTMHSFLSCSFHLLFSLLLVVSTSTVTWHCGLTVCKPECESTGLLLRYPLPMDIVSFVTRASSISSSEFSRKIPRPLISHTTTTLAGMSMKKDWIGTNIRKVHNCVSKDLEWGNADEFVNKHEFQRLTRFIFSYYSYISI